MLGGSYAKVHFLQLLNTAAKNAAGDPFFTVFKQM